MKKHYKEEIIALKLGHYSFNILFFSFILFYQQSFAQIPLNGFCKLKSFKTDIRENGKLYTLNFNGDSYTDLYLYDKNGGTTVLRGEANGNFLFQRKMQLPYVIDKFQTLLNKSKQVTGHAFISRKSRRVGIASVATYGTFSINQQIQLSSFPEKLVTADVNKNGVQELLVSGTSFDGISLISLNNNKLIETKIVKRGSFPEITLTDLSNNNYPDIATFNITSGNLEFFYNSTNGQFRKVRDIPVNGTISHLISFDINLDGYMDLLFINNHEINILYGDSISSYNRRYSLKTDFNPDEFVVGDFNKNGLIDIVYLNKREGVISFVPQKENEEFFNELTLMKKKGLTTIIPFYSRFISGVAAYNNNGEVYTISRILSFSGDIDLTLGASPGFINGFDAGNNGISDLTFIDEVKKSIYIVLRNSSGIPDLVYSIPLFSSPNRIRIEDTHPNNKFFYCFGIENNVIEVINFNISNNNIKRENIYVDGNIKDVRIKKIEGNEIPKIYVLTSKVNNLSITTFTYKDFRYNKSNIENIVSNTSVSRLSVLFEPLLYYWKTDNDSLTLSSVFFERNTTSHKNLLKVKNTKFNIKMLTGDFLNSELNTSLSFLTDEENTELILVGDDFYHKHNLTYENKKILVNENKEMSYTINYLNGLNKVFIYNSSVKRLFRMDFLNKGKKMYLSPLVEAENVNHFIIRNMTPRDNHFIYTDKENKIIRIVKI